MKKRIIFAAISALSIFGSSTHATEEAYGGDLVWDATAVYAYFVISGTATALTQPELADDFEAITVNMPQGYRSCCSPYWYISM